MSDVKPILITGATGQLGGMIIQELLEKVEPSSIIAMARSPEKASALAEKGVQVRAGDYTKPETLGAALEGAGTVMLISGTDIGPRVGHHKNVVDAAKAAGAQRIVYTSVVIAGQSPEPIFDDHRITEEYIQASGLAYTILRDNFYMDAYVSEIPLAMERGFYQAGGSSGSAMVSREDIARSAAAVLADEKYTGRVYNLTGPGLVDGKEFARIASDISGREIELRIVSLEEIQKDYEGRGYPAEHMPFLILLEKTVTSGMLADVSGDVETLTGRAPLSFESYVRQELKA